MRVSYTYDKGASTNKKPSCPNHNLTPVHHIRKGKYRGTKSSVWSKGSGWWKPKGYLKPVINL